MIDADPSMAHDRAILVSLIPQRRLALRITDTSKSSVPSASETRYWLLVALLPQISDLENFRYNALDLPDVDETTVST